MKKIVVISIAIALAWVLVSCETAEKVTKDPFERENKKFLKVEPKSEELFRVLFTSEKYVVSQMRLESVIQRKADPGGDRYMMEELSKYDKINEAREGLLKVWLYPDSGRIMKIRPQQPIYLLEIDKLLTEDLQRWTFEFPKNYVTPTVFKVRYRVVLRKKQSDEDIMKEIREKMKEEQ